MALVTSSQPNKALKFFSSKLHKIRARPFTIPRHRSSKYFEIEKYFGIKVKGRIRSDIYLKRRGEAQRRKLDKIKKRGRDIHKDKFLMRDSRNDSGEKRVNRKVESVEKQQRVIDQGLTINKKILKERVGQNTKIVDFIFHLQLRKCK